MGDAISVKPKKRGRPATGRDPLVGVRISPELLALIDAWAAERGITRSSAIRAMVEATVRMGGLAVDNSVDN